MKIKISLLLLLLIGCNPVKQVLRDQEKLEEVAKVVVKGGWCANDTTFVVKSDTLIEFDTLVNIDIQVDTQKVNEFVYITNWKTRDIIKSVTIHDTVKSFIVDNARVRLLQADSARLGGEVIEWKGKAKRRQIWLLAIIAMIFGALYIKSKI
jgi:hypothetical protein